MPKIYQLGESCEKCGTPTIQGPKGIYCRPCYINWKNSQNAMTPDSGGYHPQTSPQATGWPPAGFQRPGTQTPTPQDKSPLEQVMDERFERMHENIKTALEKRDIRISELEKQVGGLTTLLFAKDQGMGTPETTHEALTLHTELHPSVLGPEYADIPTADGLK